MKKTMKLVIGILCFILLLCIAFFGYNALSNRESASRVGGMQDSGAREQQARDFSMTDWDGNTIRLSGLIASGRPVVVNFWASWCPPCIIEMPDFEKMYLETGSEVQFVMLNLTDGMRETIQSGKRFIEEHGFSFPVFFDTTGEASSAYSIRSIPTTVFIDKNGYLAGDPIIGMLDERTLRERVEFIR